ncbi:MAG: tRNA dihydrouridine(20/20a) synthase DusA [Gammaproteobacteria bacterium]|nr:tRNA dihydrouridine(20/20a) synthase DusA [Gammaproteobacteria bacterium]
MPIPGDDKFSAWRLCIAPMMKRTDRHFRYLLRLISPRARLYTEMITTGAILYGDRDRLLAHDEMEHPVAVQLGGSDIGDLTAAAGIAAAYDYDEINLNCGCPSDRVRSGRFGACLMAQPALVADCVKALRDSMAASMTLSVKLRLGIDDLYNYPYFRDFVGELADAGCRVFHVHARKACLSGFSPAENREIPPLNYDWVYHLKRDFPDIGVVLNGGIVRPETIKRHLSRVDGIMVGRHAYADPFAVMRYDRMACGDVIDPTTRSEIVRRYLPYIERERSRGVPLKRMSRHLLNLFKGQPGAKRWRRHLTHHGAAENAGTEVVSEALACVSNPRAEPA